MSGVGGRPLLRSALLCHERLLRGSAFGGCHIYSSRISEDRLDTTWTMSSLKMTSSRES